MLTEYLCHRMGWIDVWYAHPGPVLVFPWRFYRKDWRYWLLRAPLRKLRMLLEGRWHAGVWSGRDGDLLCIKRCDTNEEAERYLSPSAPTVLLACLASWCKAWRLGYRYVPSCGGKPCT